MKQQRYVIGALLVAAFGTGLWWLFGRHAAQTDPAPAAADNVSVLVKTAPVQKQVLPLTMNVFGEVATGKPEALSFPQAGQLARLAVIVGQQVRRGDLIALMNTDPLAQTAYAQAASALAFAQAELRRNQELLALQLATQSQVDSARKQLQDAQAALAAQAKLGGAQASAKLAAPFDGVVTALPVVQGDRVQAGAPVAQVGRADSVRVIMSIEPAQAGAVKPGMPVSITPVQNIPTIVHATVGEVQSLVDPKTLMTSAIATLPATRRGQLLSGMRVQASIELGTRLAWVVPRQAVLYDDKGTYVFQVANQHARRVDVVKLTETNQIYGVDGKIDGKLPVVVLGNYELRDGMRVREEAR